MARKTKKPNKIKTFAVSVATDKSVSEAAREVGVSERTGYRWMEREEVRKLVEEQSQRLLGAVPKAVSNIVKLVEEFATTVEETRTDSKGREYKIKIPVQDSDTSKMAYDATKKVLEAPGLLGSNTPSVQIGKMVINNQQNNFLSPNVLEAIRGAVRPQIEHVEVKEDEDALEGEIVDVESEEPLDK